MKKIFPIILTIVLLFNISPFSSATENKELSTEDFISQLVDLNQLYGPESFGGISGSLEDNLSDVPLNRLIVKTVDNNYLQNDCGAVAKIETYNNLHIMQYSNPSKAEKAYEFFNSLPNVEYVDYDFCFCSLEPVTECIEYQYSSKPNLSWGADAVHSDDSVSYTNYLAENAPEIIVAVLDTGVDMDHNYLKNRIADGGVDLIEDDENPDDDHGHGTMVAGIIADNTASNVKIRSYKTFYQNGYTTYTMVCTAIALAVQDGADIVNLSFSWQVKDENGIIINDKVFEMLEEHINYAVNKGAVIVAASGNSSINAGNVCPASNSNVITVSATNSDNISPVWSNWGECVDISAPGDTIVSTFINNTYASDNGTSFSAPFVAAAAAFLKTLNRNYSHADIEDIIKSTAFVPKGWDYNYGAGILDFSQIMNKYISAQPKIYLNETKQAVITSENEDTVFYYTTSGAKPSAGVSELYFEPIDISYADCIRAIACEEGKYPSMPSLLKINWEEDLTIRYKETVFLRTPPGKAIIECRTSNQEIVGVVNYDGTVEGVSVGKTKVVAILDSGQTVTYNITVQYSWWQQLIRIFLFGFLWY